MKKIMTIIVWLIFCLNCPTVCAGLCAKGDRQVRSDCLINALLKGGLDQRREAAEILGRGENLQAERVVPVLVTALGDQDVKVRREVVSALGHYGKKAASAEEALRQASVADEDRLVRLRARVALKAVIANYHESTKINDYVLNRELTELEREIHDLEMAVKALSGSCHARFSSSALITIRQLGPKAMEALPLVMSRYDECRDEMVVRAAAVKTMAAIEISAEVKSVLVRAFSDPKPMVRAAAAETARLFPPDDVLLSALINLLGDKDYKVVVAAALSLGELGESRAVNPLISVLNNYETPQKHQRKSVIKAATKALKQIGTPEALAVLE